MKSGNWVPISKGFLKHLPKDRRYTKLEAAFSLQVDFDLGKSVTVSGYADLWRWSRKKVKAFLDTIGVCVLYPENTQKKQNQKGQISIQIRDRSGTDKGQIRFINNNMLEDEKNRKGTDKEQIRDRSGSTTKDPNPKPNKYVCPQSQIVDLYHDSLPELARVKIWSEERQAALRARWTQAVSNNNGLKSSSIEWWKGFFEYIKESDFLMGRTEPHTGRKRFKANLEWIVKKKNFINILEGKYHS
jgi:hypothetical protein